MTISLLLFISCSSDFLPSKPTKQSPKKVPANAILTLDNKLALKELIDRPDCLTRQTCPFVKVHAPAPLSTWQEAPILIIDSGMKITPLTLYPARILGFYHWQDDELKAYMPEILVPALYYEFMQVLGRFDLIGQDDEIKGLKSKFLRKMTPYLTEVRALAKHGDIVFNTLAETNPDTPFILVEPPNLPECFNPAQERIQELGGVYRKFALAIKQLVHRFNVKLINLSRGWSVPEMAELCSTQNYSPQDYRRYMQALSSFYETLASIPGTLLIQAAPNYIDTKVLLDEPWQYELDCQEWPNRIRIGSALLPSHRELPREGSYELSFMDGKSSPAFSACTDLYIAAAPATAMGHKTHFQTTVDALLYGYFGPATSYLTPLATAFINYLLHHGQSIPSLKSQLRPRRGRPLIVNPVTHGLFLRAQAGR